MHPPIDPYETGRLQRPDGADLYWEASGSPSGTPALYLHGGPGGGLGRGGYRRRFDPFVYRVIGLDQRGCGQSLPWAIDDREDLDLNTTYTLVDDIEALREHLGIDRWLLHGVSWGSTLALAYALAHPNRVTGIVLMAVTTGGRDEIDWITDGMGRVFPEAWDRVAAYAAPGERAIVSIARVLREGSAGQRQSAAEAWDVWESTHISFDPLSQARPYRADQRDRENFATLVTHYWSHDCFVEGIADRASELSSIPGILIHGRRDVSGPAITAVRLHRNWPGSQLTIVETEGHGGPEMAELAREAIDALA